MGSTIELTFLKPKLIQPDERIIIVCLMLDVMDGYELQKYD